MVLSQPLSARLRTVSVGKTASQIIKASWCLVGGGVVARLGVVVDMGTVLLGMVRVEAGKLRR
jgi:hypothetical protein